MTSATQKNEIPDLENILKKELQNIKSIPKKLIIFP